MTGCWMNILFDQKAISTKKEVKELSHQICEFIQHPTANQNVTIFLEGE